MLMAPPQAPDANTVARPTSDPIHLNGLAAGHHGHAVISRANDGLGYLDVARGPNVDAIGVGAVCRRRELNMAYVHVFAGENVEMGALAVDGFDVFNLGVPHKVESQCLQCTQTLNPKSR